MKILISLTVVNMVLPLFALTTTINGIRWTYSVTDDDCAIIGGEYGGEYDSRAVPETTVGIVRVPYSFQVSSTRSCIVTKIGRGAFHGIDGITQIVLPSGLETIGESAFENCRGLSNIKIPDTVKYIGASAFAGCDSLKDITVNQYVCNYGIGSFFPKQIVTNVLISSNVRSLGDNIFKGCTALKGVSIPGSVTNIGSSAFYECSSLATVTIANRIPKLGDYFFYGCTNLNAVSLPESVRNIGSYAFSGCKALTSIRLPSNVQRIGNHAFSGCVNLIEVNIPDSVVYLGYNSFDNCQELSHMKIPNGVSKIEDYSFFNCRNMTNIVFGSELTRIGATAFEYCSKLTELQFPDSLTNICSAAFYGCSSLTNIIMPRNMMHIGADAFQFCDSLKAVHIPSISSWCEITFDGVLSNPLSFAKNLYVGEDRVLSLIISEGVTKINPYTFYNCMSVTNVSIPSSVTCIGDYAFYNCTSLGEARIPDCVTSVGKMCFCNCTALTSVYIGAGVSSLDQDVFVGCYNILDFHISEANSIYKSVDGLVLSKDGRQLLSVPKRMYMDSVNIPYGVEVISDEVFSGCTNLQCVILPDTVVHIGKHAFRKCRRLEAITLPSKLKSIGEEAFINCYGIRNIVIPNTVTSIGPWAFEDCHSLTNLVMGDSLSDLGEGAFYKCRKVSSIVIPNSLKSIRRATFENTGLTYIVIPDCVTSIGESAFCGCTNLTNVVVSSSITKIDRYVFDSCKKLGEIIIPAKVRTIGEKAFWLCSNLTNIIFKGNAPAVEGLNCDAFGYVSPNCCVIVKKGSTGWGVTIPGKWNGMRIVYAYCSVSFDSVGGSQISPMVLDCGDVLSELPIPSREGCLFGGWFTEQIGGCEIKTGTVINESMALYAHWNPNSYRIVFDANGGAGGANLEQEYGTTIVAPTIMRGGYTFMGWEPAVAATVPASNVTYTAQWVINRYTITFYANGGDGGWSREMAYGATIEPPMVTREGYTFVGWAPTVATTVPISNVTYFAQWVINRYTMTFDPNGGVLRDGTMEYEYGSELGGLPSPSRIGCVFKGWYTLPVGGEMIGTDYHVLSNATLYARWKVDKPQIYPSADIIFTNETQSVFMQTSADGALIHYTLDGTTPTPSSTHFSGLFTIGDTCTIKAVTSMDGCENSDVSSVVLRKDVSFAAKPSMVFTTTGNFEIYDFDAWISLGSGRWVVNDTNNGGNCNMNGVYRGEPIIASAWRKMSLAIQGEGTLSFRWSGSRNGMVQFIADSTLIKGYGRSDGNLTIVDKNGVISDAATFDEIITLELGAGPHDLQWMCSCSANRTGSTYCNVQVSDIQWNIVGANDMSTISVDVSGGGIVVGGGIYEPGTNVALIAIADSGFQFAGWSGDFVGNTPVAKLLANEDKHVVAVFERVADPIPELPANATSLQVASALDGSADTALMSNITNTVEYAAYRTWALSATNVTTTAQTIKESTSTWLSYALGADTLIAKELTSDDVKIESFTPASTDGKFEFTVSVKDVNIGGGSVAVGTLKENLKKVLGIEGATTLSPGGFSFDNIDITFDTPVDGKARFTVTPPADAGNSFFMRVRVK